MVWTRRQRIPIVTLISVAIALALLVAVQLIVSTAPQPVSQQSTSWQVTVFKLGLTPGICLIAPSTGTDTAAGSPTELPKFDPKADSQTSVSCSSTHQAEVLRVISLPGTQEWSGDLDGEDGFGTPGGKSLDDGEHLTAASCAAAADLLKNSPQPAAVGVRDYTVVPIQTGLDNPDILGFCVAVFDEPIEADVGLARLLDRYATGETSPAGQLVQWTRLHEGMCLGIQTRSGSGDISDADDKFAPNADKFSLVGCDTRHAAEVLRVVRASDRGPTEEVCDAAESLLADAAGPRVPRHSVVALGSEGDDESVLGVCVAVFDTPTTVDAKLASLLDSLAG